jgi:hypothetical protein
MKPYRFFSQVLNSKIKKFRQERHGHFLTLQPLPSGEKRFLGEDFLGDISWSNSIKIIGDCQLDRF